MSNKRGRPKCTISEFFVEVPGDDGKPKFWNSSDKEMACTFCLKKNENSFEYLERGKEIVIGKPRYYTQHLLACLNAPSDLRQELQGEANNIGDASESSVLSKRLKSNHNEERFENGISKYLLKSPTDKWIKEFQEKLLNATISNGWSFQWIENNESLELLHFLNPTLQLKSTAIPSRRTLGGKLLNTAANKLQTKTIKTLQSAKAITLTFDGWKNVAKQNILGITCITKEGEVIIYDARDISSERSSMEATIKLVKDLLIEDELKDVKIIAVVTDSSSGYAAACRKLRKELSTIIWLPCFAHQANLCIVDIFKSSQSFFTTIKQAVVVTTFFNKSPFFTTLLKNTCNDLKIPYFALTNPTKTRWYSYFNCIRALLKSLSVTHGTSIRIHDKKALLLSQSVTSILDDRKFFNDLRILKAILKPFVEAIVLLEKNNTRLYHVLICFGHFSQIFSKSETDDQEIQEFKSIIIKRLEKHWKDWEQLLLLLAYFLNPDLRLSNLNLKASNISFVKLCKYAQIYYEMWAGNKPQTLANEMTQYRDKTFPFDDYQANQFKDTPLRFWKYVEEEAPELAFIINSASVERLFSDMGFIHSKRQVRLNEKKVMKIAQLRANQRKENMKKLDSKKLNSMQIHAQKKSSINNMNTNNEVSVNVESSTNQMIEETDSSDEEIESELILDELDCTRVVNEWFMELDDEVYEAEDYDLDNTEILHLAEDPQAKWNLNTLFSSTLSNLSSIEL
ncbi:14606_t:CDS:2 [Dentiscutata heterogama]|uniref:14606_t:CDS:1 n=1 Tax=Dentiscutata heterogama TaxID=1316150 RepID=A0ACA9L9Y2_9GLOM|nr:14606_t:CDS:2 [Dentiscutata heterogama]